MQDKIIASHMFWFASHIFSEKSVAATAQNCLTPFVTLNDSETQTFTIIPVCRAPIIVLNLSGHPYFLSSCHSLVFPTVSNALLKSTNTMYSGRSCSRHFSCSYRRQNIISTVFWLPQKPHCVSGTTSGVIWLDSLLRRILAKILPSIEKERFPIVPTVCSMTFLVDSYFGHCFILILLYS